MKFQSNFTYLKTEQMKTKEGEKNFLVLHLLDDQNNPCRFFIFDSNLMNKIINSNMSGLQDVLVTFTLNYTDKGWNVKIEDFEF